MMSEQQQQEVEEVGESPITTTPSSPSPRQWWMCRHWMNCSDTSMRSAHRALEASRSSLPPPRPPCSMGRPRPPLEDIIIIITIIIVLIITTATPAPITTTTAITIATTKTITAAAAAVTINSSRSLRQNQVRITAPPHCQGTASPNAWTLQLKTRPHPPPPPLLPPLHPPTTQPPPPPFPLLPLLPPQLRSSSR